MSYHLSENNFHRLYQTRDAIRLLKHSSQEAGRGSTLYCSLLASYLTLMDEQLSLVIEDTSVALPRRPVQQE